MNGSDNELVTREVSLTGYLRKCHVTQPVRLMGSLSRDTLSLHPLCASVRTYTLVTIPKLGRWTLLNTTDPLWLRMVVQVAS